MLLYVESSGNADKMNHVFEYVILFETTQRHIFLNKSMHTTPKSNFLLSNRVTRPDLNYVEQK